MRLLGAYTSSHCSSLDSRLEVRADTIFYRRKYNHIFTHLHSYRGISFMRTYHDRCSLTPQPKPQFKITQLLKFEKDLAKHNETDVFFLGLSNDWKSYLSKEGELISLKQSVLEHWEKLSPDEKANFRVMCENPLSKPARKHIEEQFVLYGKILKGILGKSSVTTLYHCSILERLNRKYPHLDLLFLVFNGYLQKSLLAWSKSGYLINKHGEKIVVSFVSVQKLFYTCPNPRSLFLKKEVDDRSGQDMTHRKSLEDIMELVKIKLKK